MTEPEIDMQNVAIAVVIHVNTAGEQHVDVEFHSLLHVSQSYPEIAEKSTLSH